MKASPADFSSDIHACWCRLLDLIECRILILGSMQGCPRLDRIQPKSGIMAIRDIRVELSFDLKIFLGHGLPHPEILV